MKKWLFDTDVLIDYLRGVNEASLFLEKTIDNSLCFISVFTIAELYAGVKEGNERRSLEKFLQAFDIVSFDHAVGRAGGLYRRDYGRSHGVGLMDAMIAASAEASGTRLVTLNKKHFPMLKNVYVPYSKA
jgi:predicted nucleic acid-binding protein